MEQQWFVIYGISIWLDNSVEFESNDYENYIATWKNAHYILLHGKIRMQNYMYIMIATIITLIITIITYEFSCTGIENKTKILEWGLWDVS